MEERYVGFVEGAEVGGAGGVKIVAFYGGIWRRVSCGGGAVEIDRLAGEAGLGSWVEDEDEGGRLHANPGGP